MRPVRCFALLMAVGVAGCASPGTRDEWSDDGGPRGGDGGSQGGRDGGRDLAIDLDGGPDGGSHAHPDGGLADMTRPGDMTPIDGIPGCAPQDTPCDYICQNGCGPGKMCVPGGSGSSNYCLKAGTATVGQSCAIALCAAGNLCLLTNESGTNQLCYKLCRQDGDCPGGGTCTPLASDRTVSTCSEPLVDCDPVENTGCGEGTACFPVTADGRTGCVAPGSVGPGGTCDGVYACQAGYACISFNGSSTSTCHKLCDLGSNDCGGTACNPVKTTTSSGDVAWTDYGVCN